LVGVWVAVAVGGSGVLVGVWVAVAVGGSGVFVGVSVGVAVSGTAVLVGVSVGVAVSGTAVLVGVSVGVAVSGTAVFVGVSVGVEVAAEPMQSLIRYSSMRVSSPVPNGAVTVSRTKYPISPAGGCCLSIASMLYERVASRSVAPPAASSPIDIDVSVMLLLVPPASGMARMKTDPEIAPDPKFQNCTVNTQPD
jgi:hypothetical protein